MPIAGRSTRSSRARRSRRVSLSRHACLSTGEASQVVLLLSAPRISAAHECLAHAHVVDDLTEHVLCSVVGHFCPISADDATQLKEGDVAKMCAPPPISCLILMLQCTSPQRTNMPGLPRRPHWHIGPSAGSVLPCASGHVLECSWVAAKTSRFTGVHADETSSACEGS